MDNKKPEFTYKDEPVISLVTELHSLFRDYQSYYEISKGELLSQSEKLQDKEKAAELQAQLRQVNDKIDDFRILGHALSIASTLLHSESMIAEFNQKK